MTANVDFAYLREAIDPVAQALGPVTQRQFLLSMGLEMRTKKLVDNAADPERKMHIAQGAERLINPTGMGSQYKVMGIVPKSSIVEEKEVVYPFA